MTCNGVFSGLVWFLAFWRSQLGVLSPSPPKAHWHDCISNIELVFNRNPQATSKFDEAVQVDVMAW
jgi:hypothetical protein